MMLAPRRLRVLHVMEAIGGGTARHLIDVVRHTPSVSHTVAIPRRRVGHLSDDHAVTRLRQAGVDVRVVEMRRLPVHWRNAASLVQLTRIARELRPEVIHGHAAIGGALARAIPSPAVRVYTPHGVSPARAALALERMLALRTDHLVAVSASESISAVDLGLAQPQQVFVIPNGVDLDPPERVDVRAALGLPPSCPVVGTIARLVPQKAPAEMLATFRSVSARRPDAHFVVIGDGPQAAAVDEAATTGPLAGRLHRIPMMECAEAAIPSFSVFVLLSAFEGGPYAPLQAARVGVPLVLTDVVGNRDVVEAGVSGELVPFGDAELGAEAIVRLLDDRAYAQGLASTMKRRLEHTFSVGAMGRAYADFYVRAASHLDARRPALEDHPVGRADRAGLSSLIQIYGAIVPTLRPPRG